MQVNKHTLIDIGLLNSEDQEGLASHLCFCRTNGGVDIFNQILLAPLSTQKDIEERQEAIAFFIQELDVFTSQKTTNGTSLVIEKFFETSFNTMPTNIGYTGAIWYQYVNRNDYSLIKYSIEHLVSFIKDVQDWLHAFKKYRSNKIIASIHASIQDLMDHPILTKIVHSNNSFSPQATLELGYFFHYQYKNATKTLLKHYYQIDAFYSMAKAIQVYQFSFPIWRSDTKPYFKTAAAQHPLVKNAISNELHLNSESNFLFLTGANMAGKSTFIKTVGIVVYLAHLGMGTPSKFTELTVMDGLITNLSVVDNLAKGESYFFKEVKNIKEMLEKMKEGNKYMVLIDELFKGTNIQDAMKCSTKVIEGLQKIRSSLFILSTHLYEISSHLEPYLNIQFSYFETYVSKEELQFSYSLKKGVSNDRIGYLILEREGVVKLLDSF